MLYRQQKIKKKHWLKCPIAVPPPKKKMKFEPKYKLFKISYSISGMQSFYICPDIPVEVIRDFF